MRTLVLKVFDYSLDGIIAVEDTEFFEFCRELPDDPDELAQNRQAMQRADVHIMGRVTYEGMAEYFPTAAGHPYADVMNAAPKAVFSTTLKTADWNNTVILSGDIVAEIEKLKRAGTGEILAHGGISFARSLIERDLVDEYRLAVFPYVAGSGRRLFEDQGKPRSLALKSATPFGNGVVELVYGRAAGAAVAA
jgi:dihydrofolate reductase